MTSDTRPNPLGRPRATALMALLSLALFLACIPAATARSDHERGSSHERGAPHERGAAEPPASAQPSESAKPAVEPKGAQPAGAERDAGHDHGPTSAQHTQGDGGAATQGAKADAKSTAGSEAGSSPEGRRQQERAERPKRSHVSQGKAKTVEAARPSTLSSEPASAPAPASSSAPARSPAASATATAATAVPAVASPAAKASQGTGAAPSVARRSAQATGAKRHRQKRGSAARTGSAARQPTAEVIPAATSTDLTASSASPHPKPAVKHAAPAVRTSPLVTTITHIVGVVPTPIRVLIAALVALALAMAARSRLTARRARRLEQQRSELLEDVGLLQAALLPVTPARLGPVGTSSAYRPAAGPAAGGDFYDVFALEDGKLAVILGDVSGHGRKALPHTALLRFTLRAYLEAGLSPRDAVRTAGIVLERQLGESFATVVAATYHPRDRRLVYASAGHPPPIVLGGERGAQPVAAITASSSPPIGVGMPTGIRQSIVALPGASQICFFTDGVTEARVGGELYGVQRLGAELAELGPDATAAELLDRVAETADRRPDDMAACLLRTEGGSEAPVALVEELELDRHAAVSDRTEWFLLACGVLPEEAAQIMRSAQAAAERSGSVVLELRRGEGPPQVSLLQDNVAYLQARQAARQADLKVSV